jgi:hypothetical protein
MLHSLTFLVSFTVMAAAWMGTTHGFTLPLVWHPKEHSRCIALCATRRHLFQLIGGVGFLWTATPPPPAYSAEFTPGGSLVDRSVGIQVSNPEASPSRKADNSNVLFDKDYYYKFGVAAPWISPDTTEFPKSMPFTVSQQRYDNLKKYGDRIKAGVAVMVNLKDAVEAGKYSEINDGSSPEYTLRPMGLMANGFLASENTGTTNELFLARWYVNEIYLRISDIRNASSPELARNAYNSLVKAINSYYSMMNRVITSKVGDKFAYVTY